MAPTIGLAASGKMAAQPEPTQSSDILASLPGPVIRLLVIFSRPVAWLRVCTEILLWKPGRRVESWLVVASWWALCLGFSYSFRYLLPPLLFLPLLPLSNIHFTRPVRTSKTAPATLPEPGTQTTILHTLSELHVIYGMMPASPIPHIRNVYSRFAQLGNARLIRGLVVLWATWLVLDRIVGYRGLLALLGTVVLLLPSPSFAHLVDLLSKSLAVRRGLALVFLLVFGSPRDQRVSFSLSSFSLKDWVSTKWAASRRPSLAFAFKPKVALDAKALNQALSGSAVDEDEEGVSKAEPIYFRFEVHENQRWWMGLDWTSALLPQERPSWCDWHLQPVSPPASFALPPSTSVILPAPTKSDPGARVKRTATWSWVDDDWSVVRTGPANQNASSLTMHLAASSSSHGHSQAHASEFEHEAMTLGQSPPRSISSTFGSSPPGNHHGDDAFLSSTSSKPGMQSIAEQAFAKGLASLRTRATSPAASTKAPASPRASIDMARVRKDSKASEDGSRADEGSVQGYSLANPTMPVGETIVERDDATDQDGWVYGDNKWEGMGPKGGLGRFTRRRRWQRRAVLTETITKLPSDPATRPVASPVKRKSSDAAGTAAGNVVQSVFETSRGRSADRTPTPGTSTRRLSSGAVAGVQAEPVTVVPSVSVTNTARDDMLRQRLKKAMGNVGG